jgi:hypothetical protein
VYCIENVKAWPCETPGSTNSRRVVTMPEPVVFSTIIRGFSDA